MALESFDQKLSNALKQGTDQIAEQLHEETFTAIINKIEQNERGDKKMTTKKSKFKKVTTIITAAAVLLLALVFNTQPGQAALERIRQYFEPEKQIVDQIEGEDEIIDGKLQDSEMGYVIYFDQERYKVITEGNVDRYEVIDKADYIPDVFMEITQDKNRLPEVIAKELHDALKAKYNHVEDIKNVSEPLDGIHLHALMGGTEWNDEVVSYYLVDNTQGGTFIIKQQYFLEASEGHGARFYNMLKEFVVVPVE